ncbi:hypothetical protein TNCV_3562081 [Trichonephila clavipes]|nr:hypothetical protein TNCV_3562081 [Trichonephila clavipes]
MKLPEWSICMTSAHEEERFGIIFENASVAFVGVIPLERKDREQKGSLRVTVGPTENPNMDAYIMKNPSPYLTFGRKLLRSYAWAGVLQTCTRPVVEKTVRNRL